MKIDLTNAYSFAKKYVLSKKGICLGIAIGAALFAYSLVTNRVVPMAYGSDAVGANPGDLMATGMSALVAFISFIASNYLGVKPEIIQAVVAFEKDTTSKENQRRLGAALLGYMISVLEKHPEGSAGYVLSLLNTLITSLEDGSVKDALKTAAGNLANDQYKVSKTVTPVVVATK